MKTTFMKNCERKLSKPLKFFVKKTGIKLQSKILNGLNK